MIEVTQGASPLILGLPHTGTEVPPEIRATLNDRGRALADTDWHIHTLYDGLVPDVTTVRTPVHRYVIDVNRDPGGRSLYPGQNTTTLVPLTDFDGNPIWTEVPDAAEISRRRARYHAPYHAALEAEMTRVAALHGFAILYDCHSIRGDIPFLFEGRLPDFNLGTNMGTTCARDIETRMLALCRQAKGYTSVLNGRFKGGWTTRHYGRPAAGWHAIQMELAQATYCDECPPWRYDPERAARLRAFLSRLLTDLSDWRPA
ncbi:N-formylglutamate deformylase [Phaeobacter sp. B1627]|uniref:N-formylglutamate deformylase n=1 Tax=Phaeobacter sp. B1627 TaxID=2583809 RepID=UPI001118B1AD|nr:N-formylglutamate deformylase [Phaeobacter sp. B1627]TNJ42235.1 N-formylglutamate deformylase [Phaeobacter sp. B1627]